MVQRIFNDFIAIRNSPKEIGQLESEEAEVSNKFNLKIFKAKKFITFGYFHFDFQMDLLYIMVIGKGLTFTPNKWYLMFEKIVDEYDGCKLKFQSTFQHSQYVHKTPQ